MMNARFVFAMIAIVFLQGCLAQEITVFTDKGHYKSGERIAIINNVKNNSGSEQLFAIETKITDANSLKEQKIFREELVLKAGEDKNIVLELNVDKQMQSGRYKVFSRLLSDSKEIGSADTLFDVSNDAVAREDKAKNENQDFSILFASAVFVIVVTVAFRFYLIKRTLERGMKGRQG